MTEEEDTRMVSGRIGRTVSDGSCNGCGTHAHYISDDPVLVVNLKSVSIRVCRDCAKYLKMLVADFLKS